MWKAIIGRKDFQRLKKTQVTLNEIRSPTFGTNVAESIASDLFSSGEAGVGSILWGSKSSDFGTLVNVLSIVSEFLENIFWDGGLLTRWRNEERNSSTGFPFTFGDERSKRKKN